MRQTSQLQNTAKREQSKAAMSQLGWPLFVKVPREKKGPHQFPVLTITQKYFFF